MAQQFFDATQEAKHLFALSKNSEPGAFQKELAGLQKDPIHYAATIRALDLQEKVNENFAKQNMSAGSQLHELNIVHDPKTGRVKEFNTREVPVEKIGHEDGLPKVILFQSADDATSRSLSPLERRPEGVKQSAESAAAAQRQLALAAQTQREAAAAREAQSKTQTEATNLLTKLQNHDGPGFAREYNSLNDRERSLVGQTMQVLKLQNHDQSMNIAQNPDGSIKAVEKNGKLEYITPGAFINAAIDKIDGTSLNAYYKGLSPEDKHEFANALAAEAPKHNVRIEMDETGNLKHIKDANNRKIYPASGLGNFWRNEVQVNLHAR